MKKQHLDPRAKRDFSVLSEEDKKGINYFLMGKHKKENCPFSNVFNCKGKDNRCVALFPEIKPYDKPIEWGYEKVCPCSILHIKDVIKIAKQAIAREAVR